MSWETWDTHVLGTIMLLILAVAFTGIPTISLWAMFKFGKEIPRVVKVFIIPLAILFYALSAITYCGAAREADKAHRIYSKQRALERAREEQEQPKSSFEFQK